MQIGRQWEERLRLWAEELPRHYYRPWGTLETEYFTTMGHLTLQEAEARPFAPAPVGMRWGRKWEYGWFRTRLTVPGELTGARIVLHLGTAEEMLVFVNGREAGSIDKKHPYLTLSRHAVAGERYEIAAECYAGHGPRLESAGIVAWGEASVPEPPELQVTVGPSHFGVWNETVFEAAMDYLTLFSLVQKLPERSLRAERIVEGLKKFTYIADLELPEPELTESAARAGEVLKPLLACHNGSTAPEFTVFGQSHLDLAWLWPVEETERKAARTYANTLALMEEYGDYRFLLCEPPILEWLRKQYPNLFERVREKVSEGKFLPEGSLWVECDTLIPSGESLIRQFTWGKRWFRRELGTETRLAWMPDTFGFSAALPQIMVKCKAPYFATQKLSRQDPEAQPFPYNLFWWEGIDGSRVLTHFFKKNNADFDSGDLVTRWEEDRVQREGMDGMLYPFGYGDGGGGPTREMVEKLRRCADLEGAPRCRVESPTAFFQRQTEVENVYKGELYLAWHRGTLTSQARTKRGIRKAETALKLAEYQAAQRMLTGAPLPPGARERLEALWEKLLFNEFHDISPGTSIARVHERAERELREVREGAWALLRELTGAPGESSAVSNHLSWPRRVGGVTVPAQGRARIVPETERTEKSVVDYFPETQYYELRNARLTCLVDRRGQVVSVKRTGSDREFLSGPGNRFLMFKDVNPSYDAWELGSMYESLPVELPEDADIRPTRDGDGAALLVERRLGASRLWQTIRLGDDAERLEFVTKIDWQERHKLLKVAFPVDVYATRAIHEIQFGNLTRPTHRSMPSDRDRYEVSCQRFTAVEDGGHGAAVLNDGKYGVNVLGSEIRLTLLRSPLAPDMDADRGQQEFTYAFYPFEGPFKDSNTLREAVELNEPPVLVPAGCPQRPILVPDRKNIVVDTVKPADTAEHALLARVYEAMGVDTDVTFRVGEGIGAIQETDMLEEDPAELGRGKILKLRFRAFEIKTLLLRLETEVKSL